MARVAVGILVAVLGLVIICVGSRYSSVYRDLPIEPEGGAKSVDQVTEVVRRVCQHQYAAVFVHLNWALLDHERYLFQDFARAYTSTGNRPNVSFHIIDFTPASDGYIPLAALPGWDNYDPCPNSHQINGVGEIIWLDHGRIVGIGRLDRIHTTEELINLTRSNFACTLPDKE